MSNSPLQELIKTIPPDVAGKSTGKLITALLAFLAEDTSTCDELASTYALQILNIVSTLKSSFNVPKALFDNVPSLSANDDHISYLKKILIGFNMDLKALWIPSYGGYTDPSEGPFPVPGADDYT